jgi:hypothetical protein
MAVKKSVPFSLRLSPRLDARITATASRTKRSKAAVLEDLADEAERCRRYPGIAFRGREGERRAWLIGTGLDVWQVIEGLRDYGYDTDRMTSETELTSRQIELAAAYEREFAAEIEEWIAVNRRPLPELQAEYPFIRTLT